MPFYLSGGSLQVLKVYNCAGTNGFIFENWFEITPNPIENTIPSESGLEIL